MAGPVKVKVSGDVEQGLQVLTAAELYQYTGQLILEKFASVNTGTSSVNVTTGSVPANHASIGTFTDRKRNDAVGTHPTSAASTTVNTYTMYQNETTNSATITTPVTLNADGDILEMTAAEINTEICDAVIEERKKELTTSLDDCCKSKGPKKALLRLLKTMIDASEEIAESGCPHGRLCNELSNEIVGLTNSADDCLKVLLEW